MSPTWLLALWVFALWLAVTALLLMGWRRMHPTRELPRVAPWPSFTLVGGPRPFDQMNGRTFGYSWERDAPSRPRLHVVEGGAA